MKQRKPGWIKKLSVAAAASAMLITPALATENGVGSDWLNSNIVDYITEDTPADYKNDFALAVNKDYAANTKIAPGRYAASTIYSVADNIQIQLIDLLDNDMEGHDPELVRKMTEIYGDWERRNTLGIEPIMPYVNDILSLETIEDINAFVCDAERNYENYGMPAISALPAYDDPDSYTVVMEWPAMQAGYKDYYEPDSDVGQRELNYHRSADLYMLQRIGYSEEEAEDIYQQALSFEKKMAENLYTYEETNLADYSTRTNNPVTAEQLQEICGNYPLKEFLGSRGMGDSEEYNMDAPEFITAMQDIWTEENVSEIRSYLLITYLYDNISNIDRDAYDYMIDITSDYRGTDAGLTEDEIILKYMTNNASMVLDNVFIETYGDEEVKEDILNMCSDISDYYRTLLASQDWLGEETRRRAINKLENIHVFACYPDEPHETDMYDIADGSNVIEMTKQIREGDLEKIRRRINTKVDRSVWGDFESYTTNAFYDPQKNSITILTGILGKDIYEKDWTMEQKLAGIGTVIGHEISHAFDSAGAQYDEIGALNNWWTEEDAREYQKRVEKLIAYYDAITPDVIDMPYSGEQVKGEALADMTGMKAVLGILEDKEDIDYESFFKQYAKLWALVTTRELEIYRYFMTDVHPLSYLRINCTLQQFDEFLETFDVQPGDGMYLMPEDRILVW